MILANNRRAFGLAGAALALAFSFWPATALAQARPAIDAFFQNPDFADARMSPGGRHVAITVSAAGGRTKLMVVDTSTLAAKAVGAFTDADVHHFEWINDDRLLFNVRDWQTGQGDNYFGPGLFAVSREGGEFKTLMGRGRNQPTHLSGRLRSSTYPLAMTHSARSQDVFVGQPTYDIHRNLEAINLLRLDTETGKAIPFRRPGKTVHWLLDHTDQPRVTVTREDNVFFVRYDDPATGEWRTLTQFDAYGNDGFWPIYLDAQGTLYVRSSSGRDTQALYRFDLKANKLDPEPIVSLPGYDVGVSLLVVKGRLVGLRYQTDAPGTVWFDPAFKEIQQKVDSLLPGTINQLSVGSRPETSQVLVHAFSDVDPGRYLLFDTASGKLTELGRRMGAIEPREMAAKEMVRYPARDGLSIPAYLTLPRGGPKKDLPLVVLVHGGPWIRGSSWGWDAEVQFLASRGYAVLQPEFRGSTGFGYKHFKAGWKQWGLAMQDDLADGTRWAIAQGIADPKRICIAGASYGGYATLMGLVNDPELFRCGVNWLGVTDIDLLYSITWSDSSEEYKRYGLPLLVGDRERDAAQIRKTSPLSQALRIKQPALLAYGGADRRVPIAHGTRFRDAVQQENKQVEWVEYTEEGNGWALVKNRVDFWTRVEKFLEHNIGAR